MERPKMKMEFIPLKWINQSHHICWLLTVGDLAFASTGRNSGVYAEPAMLEKSVWELNSMQSMIDSAEKLYGPYAWERYDVVILPPSFPFGGMENPRLTFATPYNNCRR